MPAWSFEATPYEWVRRQSAVVQAARWGIEYDHALEEIHFPDLPRGSDNEWTQDRRNQVAMLDTFFSAIVPAPEPAGRLADDEAEHRGAGQPLRVRDGNEYPPPQASMQIAALAARRSPQSGTQNI
jgi:hypothetical protein